MSSHHDWADEVIAQHKRDKPFAPENGQELKFKVGDDVIYTNSNGATFRRRITGLYQPTQDTTAYARGARYLLNMDCHWVPVEEACLTALEDSSTMSEREDRNPNPWVVVIRAGQDDEDIWGDYPSHAEAARNLKEPGEPAQIMKRLDTGELTTEF